LRNNRSDAGFTLIELLVVIVILGMIGTLLVARGPLHSTTLDLRGTAQVLASSLRQTRMLAIASDTTTVLRMNAAQRTYIDMRGRYRTLPPGVSFAANSAMAVTFFPDGSASEATIRLSEGGHTIAIHTAWLTGAVSIGGP